MFFISFADMKNLFLPVFLIFSLQIVRSQTVTTAEEKLSADSSAKPSHTTIGGYGNAFYQRDFNAELSEINLERFVLFVGHKFSDRISFFGELEIEDAKIEGGHDGGEVAIEQCLVRFNINRDNYIVGGLFIPRIGILNENHLPTSFNGNERTLVEIFIIPTTWRELGVSLFGKMKSYPLSYSLSLMNGLNSAGFEHGNVLREGRFEGAHASANNLAISGALGWKRKNISVQLSGYAGGSVGLTSRESDSLRLEGGMFGTPVMLGEADVQYKFKGIAVKILGTVVSIPDASTINRAYSSNVPESAYGFYGELGYDFLYKPAGSTKQLIGFARYEKLDMNAEIPANGITDGTLDQSHIIIGIKYLPVPNVAL
jgi:hypothetical protein